MDITTALASNAAPTAGTNSTTISSPAENLPDGQNVAGQQMNQTDVAQLPASASTQTAFNDALLNIINGLLVGQGKELKPQIAAGHSTLEGEDNKGDETSVSADLTPTPQQMLDSLLMASQLPVKPVTMNSAPSQSGEALLMAHRSNAGIAPTPAAQFSAAMPVTLPVAEATIQAGEVITKGMQSITQLPMATTLGESLAAVSTTISSAQNATMIGADKPAAPQSLTQTLKLEGGEDRWSQQLQSALGERLQVQVKNQIQHATIRLDPPDMGKIDISMQIENGRMQVHINASQGEVYRALQQVSNDLRQSLTEQNFVQVNVQVSSQSGQQHSGKEQAFSEAQQSVLAGADIESDLHQTERLKDESVLLTV